MTMTNKDITLYRYLRYYKGITKRNNKIRIMKGSLFMLFFHTKPKCVA